MVKSFVDRPRHPTTAVLSRSGGGACAAVVQANAPAVKREAEED